MRDSGSAARAHNPPAEHPGVVARASRKDVVVFTSDDEFLLTLGPALDDRYRSRPTDGTGAWTEALRGRSGVALVDAATLTNAPELVRTIEAEFPAFAIAVVAPGAAHPQWSGALSRGSIARLLDRDALSNETIASTLEIERRTGSAEASPRAATTSRDGSSGRSRMALMGGVAFAVLAIAGAAWMWLGGKDAAPAPRVTTTAHETAPALTSATGGDLSVPELLSAARVAFGEHRYVEPAGNNALELYARVLSAEPGNAEAADGVRRVIAVAAAQLQSQIKAGQLDDASRLLDTLRTAAPEDVNVAALGQDLAAARPKWLVTRAREAIAADQYATAERLLDEISTLGADRATVQDLRRSLDARRKDAELARAVADARASLTSGALLDNSPDGPRARLAALQKMDRKNAQVVAFQRDYQTALARSAREATRSGDFAGAERLLAAAADIGSSRDVTDARKELQAARESAAAREQQQQRASAATQRAETEAARVAATPPPPKMPKARKRTAPQYPQAAERAGIEGSVTVEFGLTPEGHTRDIRVVESSPPEVFDAAAIAAVRTWRFESVSAEDAARLPRSSVRLAFRIGDRE